MEPMPVEPAPSPWMFPDLRELAGSGSSDEPDDLVAMGADLEPGTLLAAYRCGLFPMPDASTSQMLWWSPVARGVLPLDRLKVSRSLRQSAAKMEVRVDTAFVDVVTACADPARDSGWIDGDIAAAYTHLHWRDGELVGGLYGVAIGGLFAGESMFHTHRDASKVALLGLVDLLRDEHAGQRLLDVQWQTPHLASLGVVEIARPAYLDCLSRALAVPLPKELG
jgi:leucyl/phenylalanyl-tRNA---protein transferase